MRTTVFILGSHPALSATELSAYAERTRVAASWDLSRLPAVLRGSGLFPSPPDMLKSLGGTVMIGVLKETFPGLPTAGEILRAVPEILRPRQGKRLVGLSALPCPAELQRSGACPAELQRSGACPAELLWSDVGSCPTPPSGGSASKPEDVAAAVRRLAMELKRAIGMKGTRVVFPPAGRPDLSTAQLLHNALPQAGTAVFFLVAPQQTDLVVIEAIQDIEAYARRDRGRPHADPGSGMLPPKVAQMMVNLSLISPGGTMYDPFCGVGTIPMEAMGMGLSVAASDASAKQVQRTKENLAWFGRLFPAAPGPNPVPNIFVHGITAKTIPLAPDSVDAVVSEGWLGPARNVPSVPQEADKVFAMVTELLENLFSHTRTVVRKGGRLLIAVPAFRAQKRLLRFPLDRLRAKVWTPERLVPEEWRTHQTFREAARGTLLYGRPDAKVLREIVRFRKVS